MCLLVIITHVYRLFKSSMSCSFALLVTQFHAVTMTNIIYPVWRTISIHVVMLISIHTVKRHTKNRISLIKSSNFYTQINSLFLWSNSINGDESREIQVKEPPGREIFHVPSETTNADLLIHQTMHLWGIYLCPQTQIAGAHFLGDHGAGAWIYMFSWLILRMNEHWGLFFITNSFVWWHDFTIKVLHILSR
jgi:hypothetical protein